MQKAAGVGAQGCGPARLGLTRLYSPCADRARIHVGVVRAAKAGQSAARWGYGTGFFAAGLWASGLMV
ncbi:hypothetical protein HK26_03215 [Acetobacter okinawensis]|uniref:Uncharacterized protein n=1 Tax=Acetobacter okinawensis TaxID=1076594 RepID=A0A252BTL2_9PROT|nr:hypothetical protein HK26_03215 [Acetobacter okinawensis]